MMSVRARCALPPLRRYPADATACTITSYSFILSFALAFEDYSKYKRDNLAKLIVPSRESIDTPGNVVV